MNCGGRQPIAESLFTKYWGKAREGVAGEVSWHPLAYHSLDVAAVGQALFVARPALRSLLGRLTGLPDDIAQQWFLLALAWHDLGKFSDGFQAKAPHALESIGRDMPRANDYGHSALSLNLWDKALKERAEEGQWFGSGGERAFRWFLSASAGHHGSPVKCSGFPEPQESFRQPGFDDAMAFAAASHALLCPDGATAPESNESLSKRASWLVAGLAVLCDWVGSNTQWFKYRNPDWSLQDYWRDIALPKAADAIREAGLAAPAPPRPRPGADMLPLKAELSPLQRFADTVDVSGGPQIFVMEDLTGAGKTEAALILARRLMAAGAADGVYFALPTMATANAMYERLEKLLPKLFAEDASPSLALLHGKTALRQALERADRAARDVGEDAAKGGTASQNMTAWLCDDRRKAFWADIGAGTIDQALLAVLPARFQSLRLAGLARKVLIVDEAHAYEDYTLGILNRLLAFHAALGGSAIVLSATLPSKQREGLIMEFKKTQTPNDTSLGEPMAHGYPLASSWSPATGLRQIEIESAERSRRTLMVEHVPDQAAALRLVADAARAGKRVCRLVNTVDDAIEAFDALRQTVGDAVHVDLFHARFAFCDRLDKESACLSDFGKVRKPEGQGRILVATQVVEQSLDLDFDVMVTDLAPIDALIQRAGRVWRHEREGRKGTPVLHVAMPEPELDAKANWYGAMLPRAAYVYANHAQLWRTAWLLRDRPVLNFPEDARRLVEAVYGEEFPVSAPEQLMASATKDEGKAKAERSIGNMAGLMHSYGFTSGAAWEDEAEILTRLGEKQKTWRLAKWNGEVLRPWADHHDEWLAWRLSEIAIPLRKVQAQTDDTPALTRAKEAARAAWPDRDYGPEILAFRSAGTDEWELPQKDDKTLGGIGYSSSRGLVFKRSAET